jgi:MFS transporter, SP family, arabinose:H+ symporter
VPALVGLVLRTQMPESPRWLLRHNKLDAVKHAMSVLGTKVSDDQVRRARTTMLTAERAEASQGRFAAWTPAVWRAVIVVCVFFVFQQITGINVPLYYGPKLLGPYFSGAHASLVATTIAGVGVSLIITIFNCASTYFGFRWIDKFGRRNLSMGGYAGMIVFALVAALGIGFLGGIAKLAVIMLGLSGFISSFAIGVGGTGWTLQGEVFPTAVRSEAASIAATVDWLANFALIELFPVWQGAVGLGWVLVGFAGLSVVAILFIFRFLPETKGRSVEEIIGLFEPSARPKSPPTPAGAS